MKPGHCSYFFAACEIEFWRLSLKTPLSPPTTFTTHLWDLRSFPTFARTVFLNFGLLLYKTNLHYNSEKGQWKQPPRCPLDPHPWYSQPCRVNRVKRWNQQHFSKMTECNLWDLVMKDIGAFPFLFGSLILEKASCHVIRTLKQPYGQVHVVNIVWPPVKESALTCQAWE